jgi:hypothetical protein
MRITKNKLNELLLLFVLYQSLTDLNAQTALTWDRGAGTDRWESANNWNPNTTLTSASFVDVIFDNLGNNDSSRLATALSGINVNRMTYTDEVRSSPIALVGESAVTIDLLTEFRNDADVALSLDDANNFLTFNIANNVEFNNTGAALTIDADFIIAAGATLDVYQHATGAMNFSYYSSRRCECLYHGRSLF